MGVCRKHCVEKAQKKLKHFICFGKVREQINKKTKTETDRHPIAIEDGKNQSSFLLCTANMDTLQLQKLSIRLVNFVATHLL